MGRMAPTPSGFLHLGNIVNFLLTGIIAQKKASPVFLRIDDLDKDRCRDIYLEDIFHTLDFLNLPYFGPTSLGEFKKEYSQHNRIERYREVFEMVVFSERYFCTCSRREILERLGAKTSLQYDGYCRETGGDEREEGEMGAWRIKVTEHSELETKMGDFVLWQKNNLAPYQLASLVDDVDLGVTWLSLIHI